MVLDFFGGTALTALVLFIGYAFVSGLPVSPRTKMWVSGGLALWVGMRVALATTGAFASSLAVTYPILGGMVVVPVLVVGLWAWRSRQLRTTLLGVSTKLLVGLNIGRALGFFFLLVALDGRFGGPFPISAGIGDFVTGGGALLLALAMSRRPVSTPALWIWNAFGLLDLIAAVSLGALSANGAVTQVIFAGAGSDAIQSLPYSLIPSVLVPFYVIVHGIVFAQLRQRREATVAYA